MPNSLILKEIYFVQLPTIKKLLEKMYNKSMPQKFPDSDYNGTSEAESVMCVDVHCNFREEFIQCLSCRTGDLDRLKNE